MVSIQWQSLPGIGASGYSPGMRVFLYGTLLDPKTLASRSGDPKLPHRGVAAALPGWCRVALPRAPWPTLRRDRSGAVTGVLVDAPAAAMRRLAAYEGSAYRLVPVVVSTARGNTVARAWIAPGGTRRAWPGGARRP